MTGTTASPNVVVVVMDTARMVDVDPETAPTVADLAASGTGYERAFTSAPWTLPSHASLFTGTYTVDHGAHGDHTLLDDRLRTLAEAFRDEGYATAGTSNNTWVTEEFGLARGFETFHRTWQRVQTDADLGELRHVLGTRQKLETFVSHLFDGNPLANAVNAVCDQLRFDGDDGANRTVQWIERWLDGVDEPFFLFANFIEPHLQYRPPRAFAERFLPDGWSYEEAMALPQEPREYDAGLFDLTDAEFEVLRGLYRAEIAYLDARIDELRRALVSADKWEDTVFVVVGDHGENVGEHDFLGHQYCVYDTLLRVPLVISGGPFAGRGWTDRLVQVLDLAPTLLDVAGIDDPAAREQFDGRARSFHPESDEPPRAHVFAEYVRPQPSIETLEARFGDLPPELYRYDRSIRTVRTDEYKFIAHSDGAEELYRVSDDPGETRNLVDARPERAASLRSVLEERLGAFGDVSNVDGDGDAVSMTAATQNRLRDLGYL
ncbi:sulfatase [Halegenticoccus tardaugens]|uniref:sulfatase n=1 Tax=Halegenticoccus tardaugens TaxID=2071624 RepID=UPI00100BC96E|nr:sulfatase [Halegenticoccus tardaugens]